MYICISNNISYHILSYRTLFHWECTCCITYSAKATGETRCELVQLIPRVTSPSATRPRPAFKVRKTLCVLSTHGTPQQTCDVILLFSPKLRPSNHPLPSVYNTSIDDVYINTSPIKDNIGTVWYSIFFLKIKILLSQCLHNLSQNGLVPADGHRNQHALLAQHAVHLADGCLHFLWTNKWIGHIHIVKWTARSLVLIDKCSTNKFFSEPAADSQWCHTQQISIQVEMPLASLFCWWIMD